MRVRGVCTPPKNHPCPPPLGSGTLQKHLIVRLLQRCAAELLKGLPLRQLRERAALPTSIALNAAASAAPSCRARPTRRPGLWPVLCSWSSATRASARTNSDGRASSERRGKLRTLRLLEEFHSRRPTASAGHPSHGKAQKPVVREGRWISTHIGVPAQSSRDAVTILYTISILSTSQDAHTRCALRQAGRRAFSLAMSSELIPFTTQPRSNCPSSRIDGR